jgi:translocation and assembly module TamB
MTWKKIVRWLSAVLGTLILVALVAGYFVLKTPQFHRYVLAQIVGQGQAATGGKLEIQNWDFHLSPLTVDLDNIVVHGGEPPGSKPLFTADKLTVGLIGRALLRRQLQLSELLLQHPVANVSVDAKGRNNLPTPPPSQSKSNTTVWSLAVGRLLVSDGEIYYNDRKTPLNADLHDLKTEIHFDPAATRYTGNLSYRNGSLQYANYAPLPHDLDAQFAATPSDASLDSLILKFGSSQLSLKGEMAGYATPSVKASYRLQLHTQDFASLSPDAAPSGDVSLVGEARYQYASGQSLFRALSLDGTVASADLQATTPDTRVHVRNLNAQFQLSNANLAVRDITADFVEGHLVADASIKGLDTNTSGLVHASVKHLSIENARQSMRRSEFKRAPITGTVEATMTGSWTASVKNLHVVGDLGLRGAVWSASSAPRSSTPVDGVAHMIYDSQHNLLALRETTVRIPSTSVVLNGRLGDHSDLHIDAVAGDLHQLAELASSFRTASTEPESEPIAISGEARLEAVVQGSIKTPRISGQLDAQNLAVQGSQWKSVKLAIAADPSRFTIRNGSLVNARQGELSLTADVALTNWSYAPANDITANLSAKGMSLADLDHLANRSDQIAGILAANASFHGSQLHPAGHGSLQITKANAYGEPIQNLRAQFQTVNDALLSQLNLTLPAGAASASLTYQPKSKAYKVELHTSGLTLEKLQSIQARNLPLSGILTASGSGAGTIDNPQLDLTVAIPSLQLRQTSITDIKAQLAIRNERANLAMTSNLAPAFIRANATASLTGDFETLANIDTNKVPLDPFLALYVPSMPSDFHGETELHATLKGPLRDPSRIEAHVTVPTLVGDYRSLQFANVQPIHADYANSTVVLAPAEIRGTQTSLALQGRVPLKDGEMNLQARGNVNLALLAMFGSEVKSSGTIDFDVQGGGTVGNPSLGGNIHIKNAALSTMDAPVSLSKMNADLNLTGNQVQIVSLNGEVGGGQVSAGGSITYRPDIQFNLNLQAKSIRLLYPDGVRTVLSSNLTFSGNRQAATLSGRTLVDSLNFTSDFDLASFAGQFNGISVPSSGETFADNIKLQIAVQSAQNLSARSSQLNLEGLANLQIAGTAADPVVVGRIDLTSGELFFMNNRYQLQRGIITFNDPNATRPILNVQVTSTIQQYNLTLKLNGPLDKLDTSYSSDPALPTADIISLIYRGETDEEASAAGTSTDSLLAGQAASQFSGGIQKLTGISSLQIDPQIGGNNTNPSARIALQQRVTNKLLFTFSTDVTQPQQEIVQGEYQINKRWSVSVTRDELGGVAVDGRLHTRF